MKVQDYNENYLSGWIKSYRSKFSHWISDDKDYFYAWDWILHNVNHSDKKVLISGVLVDVKRGEKLTSISNFADEVKMTQQRVRSFWALLERDGMIVKKTTSKYTKITVCNYDRYQDVQQTDNKQTTNRQQTDNNKQEYKNIKKIDIAHKFYEVQQGISVGKPQQKNYKFLVDFLFGNNELKEPLKNVLSMPSQIKYESFEILKNKIASEQIRGPVITETLYAMNNWADLHKRKSVYSTLNTWIFRTGKN